MKRNREETMCSCSVGSKTLLHHCLGGGALRRSHPYNKFPFMLKPTQIDLCLFQQSMKECSRMCELHFLVTYFPHRFKNSQGVSWSHRWFLSFKINKEQRSFLGSCDPKPRISTVSSYSLLRQLAFWSPAAVSMVIKIPLQHLPGKEHAACTAADVCGMRNEGCAGGVRRASKATEAPQHVMSDSPACLPFAGAAEQGAEKSWRKISCNFTNIANAPTVT